MKNLTVALALGASFLVMTGCGEKEDAPSHVEATNAVDSVVTEVEKGNADVAADEAVSEDYDDVCKFTTASEVLRKNLRDKGIEEGLDADTGRMVRVGVYSVKLPMSPLDDENVFIKLDFPKPETNDYEATRFYVGWCAYARAVAELAQSFLQRTESSETILTNSEGGDSKRKNTVTSCCNMNMTNMWRLDVCESLDDDNLETAVAVACRSAGAARKAAKPGKYSLEEYIANCKYVTMVPCRMRDSAGAEWQLGFAPLPPGNVMPDESETRKARTYAFEAACRANFVTVEASQSLSSEIVESDSGEEYESKVHCEISISLKPMRKYDKSKAKFFVVNGDSFSTRDAKYCVCAIKVSDGDLQ